MSNQSLKEQLQALSLKPSSNMTAKKHPHKKPRGTEEHSSKQKPSWLEYAQYGVALLKAHYPACFRENKEIKPLKVGIKQDLVKHLSSREDITIADKACMTSSLTYYVNSVFYHQSVLENVMRIDLEGNPAGQVTVDEAQYSLERCQAKLQKKKNAKLKASQPQTKSPVEDSWN